MPYVHLIYPERTDEAMEKYRVVGENQLRFLQSQGLHPDHRVLDVGCGSLRGGEWLIDYLDAGNYVGLEKDPEMLRKARIIEAQYEAKRPLVVETASFEAQVGRMFDYGIAHSLFTHLLPEQIVVCLSKVLPQTSVFYATFNRADEPQTGRVHKNRTDERSITRFPFALLRDIAEELGATAKDLGDFDHPNGQQMAEFRL